jgi:hypothetical protein
MTRPSILKANETYTFSKYFELAFDPEDILAELGFTLERLQLTLPKYTGELDNSSLRQRIEQDLINVDLTSETARREVIIGPILLQICRITQSKLKIEYPININNFLKGSLNYYLQAKNNILVVEAKNADLARGFTQLAVEMIALDQWINLQIPVIYGAVTTGNIWKFGFLKRQEKQIIQDINLYRVPADLQELLQIILGIIS